MLKNILKSVKANADFFALISDLKLWRHFLIPILITVTASVLSDTIGNGIVFMFFLLVLVIGVTFIRNISFNPNNQSH
jgi:hypothetical protein